MTMHQTVNRPDCWTKIASERAIGRLIVVPAVAECQLMPQ